MISLSVHNNISTANDTFRLTEPVIKSLSVNSGVYKEPVEIYGKYFKEGMTSLYFGEHESEILSINDTIITTEIPGGIEMGNYDLKIIVAGKEILYTKKFKCLTPVINNVSPDSVTFSDTVFIEGRNFNPVLEHNNLYLDEIKMEMTYLSSDSIKFVVPNTLEKANGEFELGITVGGIYEQYENKFVLKAPKINNIFPLNVNYGDTVTISGENFNPVSSLNKLYLNDREIDMFNTTGSSFQFVIPYDLLYENGEFDIKIITGQQLDIYSSKLKVKAPVINGLSNTNVVVGDTLTIYGSNFNPNISNTILTLDDLFPEIISADYDSIQFIVPMETQISNNQIQLTVNLQETQAPETFSLLEPVINQVTPTEGYRGAEIKIIGDNFSANKDFNNVYFSEMDVSVIRSSHDTIVVEIFDIIEEGLKDIKVEIGNQSSLLNGSYTQIEPWEIKTPIAGYYSRQKYAPLGGIGENYNGYGYAGLRSEVKISNTIWGSIIYKSFYRYSYFEDSWTELAESPFVGAENLLSYNFNDSIYVVYMDNNFHQIWRYSLNEDDWNSVASHNSDGSKYIYGFGIDGKIYLMSYDGKIICYDIIDSSWSTKKDSPFIPRQIKGIEYQDKLYVISNDYYLWEYHPNSDIWLNKGVIPFNNFSSSSPVLKFNDEFYYFTTNRRVYKYNPSSQLWYIASSKSPFHQRSGYLQLIYYNYYFALDNIYMSLFEFQECCYHRIYEHFYEYDPSKDTFEEITL